MRTAFNTLLLACALCFSAHAQEANCNDPQTQFELNVCSAKEWERADAELNVVWRKARAVMKENDRHQPEEYKGAAQALLEGQRGWLAYRDGQCLAERFEVVGGSMAPMVGNLCLARMTRARTQELKQMIEPR